MPTTFTRRAGLAGFALPFTVVLGALVNEGLDRGPVHGLGVALLVAGVPAFVLAVLGLRSRHRGALGHWGTAAVALLGAAPVLALPFGWGAGAAFIAFLGLAATLLAVGMLRAGILPRVPTALFGLGIPLILVVAALGTLAGADMATVAVLGPAVTGLGLAWLGWTMWREGAVPNSSPSTPLAA